MTPPKRGFTNLFLNLLMFAPFENFQFPKIVNTRTVFMFPNVFPLFKTMCTSSLPKFSMVFSCMFPMQCHSSQ